MSAKDFVDSLGTGDNLGAENAFKSVMTDRVASALETKRKEVANTFVKSSVTKDEGDDKEV